MAIEIVKLTIDSVEQDISTGEVTAVILETGSHIQITVTKPAAHPHLGLINVLIEGINHSFAGDPPQDPAIFTKTWESYSIAEEFQILQAIDIDDNENDVIILNLSHATGGPPPVKVKPVLRLRKEFNHDKTRIRTGIYSVHGECGPSLADSRIKQLVATLIPVTEEGGRSLDPSRPAVAGTLSVEGKGNWTFHFPGVSPGPHRLFVNFPYNRRLRLDQAINLRK